MKSPMPTDADQKIIAELKRQLEARTAERDEALAHQRATSEVLQVISSSPGALEPVFNAMLQNAVRICEAKFGNLFLIDGDRARWVAGVRTPPKLAQFFSESVWFRPTPGSHLDRVMGTKQASHTADDTAEAVIGAAARLGGARSTVCVPMVKDETLVGAIFIYRTEVRPFTDKQIDLVKNFAAQAVIAIENTRLLRELREKTEDLSESLQQQTATADVLKVIASSPSDLQPVFDAIAKRSNQLLGGHSTTVIRFVGDMAELAAFTPVSQEADATLRAQFPRPIAAADPQLARVQRGEMAEIADTEAEGANELTRNLARARGFRSRLMVPLRSDNYVIGVISITRKEPGAFGEQHVELLRTFADQAVIAIKNVKLFEEVQAKTRDLTEALTYQTGSANILRVIASSPTDVNPVLKAIVESACELCGAYDALVRLKDGDGLAFGAHHGPLPVSLASVPITENSTAGAAVIGRKPVHVHDLLSTDGDRFPHAQELARTHGSERTILSVPLLREGASVGAIVLRRTEVHPFSEKQIGLLQTFADQAVIAIQNVKLFDEVQAKTRDLEEALQQQTATADVLKVISRSAFDLQTVLETLTRSAVELSGAMRGVIFLRDDDLFRFRAASNRESSPDWLKYLSDNPRRAGRQSATARAIASGQIECIPDVLADPEVEMPANSLAGIRAALSLPLLRDGKVEGVISLSSPTPGPFSQRQIELVQTFADQALIAIENARLFDAVQARTRELAQSLDDLRNAQDRLIQTEKLASLGQLTAGIAHEIKNPLNFVNNFSALSVELTDELNDVLKQATLAEKIRGEVDELTGLLKDNLGKVVQHGKRADSIVKNMLLHSREGSGEHRPADVNALVDESLNLAYHGARAEKPQFNVTLMRNFDPEAGQIEVFPQEITRVLLNLISNGFYAVTKRKADNGGTDFEPLITATTKGRADRVEIRIRDNGTGIPPHVKEKMFNPFFTTKPAGEGTGLGLSMSHDIIVKQHGGTIEVETEPGQFTEFTIVLPRTKNHSNKTRG